MPTTPVTPPVPPLPPVPAPGPSLADALDKASAAYKGASGAARGYEEVIKQVIGATNTMAKASAAGKAIQESLIEEFRDAIRTGKSYSDVTKNLKTVIADNSTALGGNSVAIENLVDSMENAIDAEVEYNKTTKELTRLQKLAQQEINKSRSTMEKWSSGLSKGTKAYQESGRAVGAFTGLFSKTTSMLGVQAIGWNSVRTATIKYNKNLFDVSKTFTAAGQGIGNWEKRLKSARSATTMADSDFAAFSDTFAKTWIGVLPKGGQAIEDFAKTIQDSYGYSTDVAIGKTKELLGQFAKFPPAQKKLIEATKLYQQIREKDAAGKNASKELKQLESMKAYLFLIGQQEGKNTAELEEQLRLLDPTNAKLAKKLELEKSGAEASKDVENAMVGAGQALTTEMVTLNKTISKMAEKFDKMPDLAKKAMGVATALGAVLASSLTLAASLKSLSALTSIGGGATAATATTGAAGLGLGSSMGAIGAGGAAAIGATIAAALATAIGGFYIGDLVGEKTGITDWAGDKMGSFVAGGDNGEFFGMGSAEKGSAKSGDPELEKMRKEIARKRGESAKTVAQLKKESALRTKNKDVVKDEGDAQDGINTSLGVVGRTLADMLATHEAIYSMVSKQTEQFGQQAGLMAEMYMTDVEGSMKKYLEAARSSVLETQQLERTLNSLGQIKGEALGKGLEDDEFAQKLKSAKGYGEYLDLLKQKKNALDENRGNMDELDYANKYKLVGGAITEATTKQNEYLAAVKKTSDNVTSGLTKQTEANLKMNQAVEGRLDAERAVMEAALFGMGASISMMQKQVDLAYNNIKVINKQIKAQDDLFNSKKMAETIAGPKTGEKELKIIQKITSASWDRLKGAKNQEEAQKIINKLSDNENLSASQKKTLQTNLNQSYMTYQNSVQKTYQSQKKIYDLTKDIREGYLDAMREMSFGAGEFEKIIGTQDMGVTQLMEKVESVTGEKRLNTMALGGITRMDSEAGRARSGIAAGYGKGGLYKGQLSESNQAAAATDVHGWEESQKKMRAQSRGEDWAGPLAGMTQSNREHAMTADALREKALKQQILLNEKTESTNKKLEQGIKVEIKEGKAPGQVDPKKQKEGSAEAINIGAEKAKKAEGMKRKQGKHFGGKIPGVPSATGDNKMGQVGNELIGLNGGEFIIRDQSVNNKTMPYLEALNKFGIEGLKKKMRGFKDGGNSKTGGNSVYRHDSSFARNLRMFIPFLDDEMHLGKDPTEGAKTGYAHKGSFAKGARSLTGMSIPDRGKPIPSKLDNYYGGLRDQSQLGGDARLSDPIKKPDNQVRARKEALAKARAKEKSKKQQELVKKNMADGENSSREHMARIKRENQARKDKYRDDTQSERARMKKQSYTESKTNMESSADSMAEEAMTATKEPDWLRTALVPDQPGRVIPRMTDEERGRRGKAVMGRVVEAKTQRDAERADSKFMHGGKREDALARSEKLRAATKQNKKGEYNDTKDHSTGDGSPSYGFSTEYGTMEYNDNSRKKKNLPKFETFGGPALNPYGSPNQGRTGIDMNGSPTQAAVLKYNSKTGRMERKSGVSQNVSGESRNKTRVSTGFGGDTIGTGGGNTGFGGDTIGTGGGNTGFGGDTIGTGGGNTGFGGDTMSNAKDLIGGGMGSNFGNSKNQRIAQRMQKNLGGMSNGQTAGMGSVDPTNNASREVSGFASPSDGGRGSKTIIELRLSKDLEEKIRIGNEAAIELKKIGN